MGWLDDTNKKYAGTNSSTQSNFRSSSGSNSGWLNQVQSGSIFQQKQQQQQQKQQKQVQQKPQQPQNIFQKATQAVSGFFGQVQKGVQNVESLAKTGKAKPGFVDPLNTPIGQGGGTLKETYQQAMKDLSLGVTPTAYAPSSQKNLHQLYQANITSIKTEPVKKYTHDVTNGVLSMLQGYTGGIFQNPVKSMTSEDLIIKPIFQMTGGAVSISKIGGAVDKVLGASSLGKFLDSTKYLKFMSPILSNTVAFDIYGQLDPNVKDRLNQLKNDSVNGSVTGLLGGVSKAAYSVPLAFGIGVGLAKYNGSDDKSALMNGVLMAALDASGKITIKGVNKSEQPLQEKQTMTIDTIPGLSDQQLQDKRLQAIQDLAKTPDDKTKQDTLKQIYEEINLRKGQITTPSKTVEEKPQIDKPKKSKGDLSKYRKALNNRDIKTLNNLGAKNPNDARFHVHEKVSGLVEQKPKTIPITQIETGLSEYINKNFNTATPKIKEYEQVLHNGGSLEPIPVYEENGKYVLNKDGFHRLQAYKNIGRTDVSIKVEPKTELSASAKQRAENTPLKPVGEGKETISGLGKSVEASALAKEMKLNLGDLPTHKTMNMEEKANKSIDLLNSDSTRAKRIAMGHEEAPSDIPAGFIFNAVKNRAIEQGDIDTLRELGTSQAINDYATAIGQQVKAFDDSNRNQEDPTKYIRTVSKSKKEVFKNKLRGKTSAKDAVNKTVDEIKQQTKKTTPDKKAWDKFISSIQC